ncbi:hypothetical protein C7974DRAFT_182547 [Boeremia exigua]|uniref:uncharacterized protein n=1 Tax=Boeremia exigua TaxID=749465 RepID=UPI001E8D86E7|nr:uncharacterized protein C7974DRAFT_182547 [Boeremia exigua]KAH6629180.1 hypothetical protein C7974DRAFT_182547 [Boeremia exigua]
MGRLSYDERVCVQFLNKLKDWTDSTWGFRVYGTYSHVQARADSQNTQDAADTARFQEVLARLRAHAEDTLRYRHPAPYNQQLIDTLRLQPAAYLPGASLAEVCTHFRQHHAVMVDFEQQQNGALLDAEMSSPKYSWCLVIDDEALQSIEAAPRPIGRSPQAGVHASHLALQAEDAFVKLLSASYVTMEKPLVLAAKGCNPRWSNAWTGWLKCSPVVLMDVFDETLSGDIEVHFRGHDKLLEFP